MEIEDGKSDRDALAASDPDGASPEKRANIAAARGTQLLDFMLEKNYSDSGTNTAICMAALLYAAGLLSGRADLSPEEISTCFKAGVRDAEAVVDMVTGKADA